MDWTEITVLAVSVAGSLLGRDFLNTGILAKAKRREDDHLQAKDQGIEAGARFEEIRTLRGDAFCGAGRVLAVGDGAIHCQSDEDPRHTRFTITSEEFRSLVPFWTRREGAPTARTQGGN